MSSTNIDVRSFFCPRARWPFLKERLIQIFEMGDKIDYAGFLGGLHAGGLNPEDIPYELFWSAITRVDKTQRREKGDLGTIINDPAFRALLRHQGAKNTIPPGIPWVLRVFPSDGFSMQRCGDASQILKEYLEDAEEEGNLLHIADCFGMETQLPAAGQEMLKQVQDKGDADETLAGMAHDSGITPSYLWDTLPDEYKKSAKEDDDLGDGAAQFYMTSAGIGHSYTGYVTALRNAAEKGEIETDFTTLTGFANYIGLHGCPVYHDTDHVSLDKNNFRNLLGWAMHLLSKDKKLMREAEFAYDFLARCCRHGLFLAPPSSPINPMRGDEGVDPAQSLLLRNIRVRYPELKSTLSKEGLDRKKKKAAVDGKDLTQKLQEERDSLCRIERRVSFILEHVKSLSPSLGFEDAWGDFLATHCVLPGGTPAGWIGDVFCHDFPGGTLADVQLISKKNQSKQLPWLAVHPSYLPLLYAIAPDPDLETYHSRSYRYLVNYVGGQLKYLRIYYSRGGDITFLEVDKKFTESGVEILRFILEISYVLSLKLNLELKMEARTFSKFITDMNEVLGDEFITAGRDAGVFKDAYSAAITNAGEKGKSLDASVKATTTEPSKKSKGAFIAYHLQQALTTRKWGTFLSLLLDWDAGGRDSLKLGASGLDLNLLLTGFADAPTITPLLDILARANCIHAHLLRSHGFFVESDFPDYAPSKMAPEERQELWGVMKDAKKTTAKSPHGSKGRLRQIAPLYVLEDIARVAPVKGERSPTFSMLKEGQTCDGFVKDQDLVSVRVPTRDLLPEKKSASSRSAAGGTASERKKRIPIYRFMWYEVCRQLGARVASLLLNAGDALREGSNKRQAARARSSDRVVPPTDQSHKESIQALLEGEDRWPRGIAPLARRAKGHADQVEDSERRNQELFKELCQSFQQNLPEFAAWAFSAKVTGNTSYRLSQTLKTKEKRLKNSIGAQLRNRFDKEAGDNTSGDILGRKINRLKVHDRLDKLMGALKDNINSIIGGTGTSVDISYYRRRGLISWFDPRLYLKAGSIDTALVRISGAFEPGDIAEIIVGLNGLGTALDGDFDAFNAGYPGISPKLPAAGSPEDAATQMQNPLNELSLALLRSLALYYESMLAALRKEDLTSPPTPVQKAYNTFRKRFLRAAYTQEFFMAFPLPGKGSAEAETQRRELISRGIPMDGIAKMLAGPAMVPLKGFTSHWGRFASGVIGDEMVTTWSLPLDMIDGEDALSRALDPRPKAQPFSRSYTASNFAIVAQKIIPVAGVIAALASPEQILAFITLAKQAWDQRAGWISQLPAGEDRGAVDISALPYTSPFAAFGAQFPSSLVPPRRDTAENKSTPLPFDFSASALSVGSIERFARIRDRIAPRTSGKGKSAGSPEDSILVLLQGKPLTPESKVVNSMGYLPEDCPNRGKIPSRVSSASGSHTRLVDRRRRSADKRIDSLESSAELLLQREKNLRFLIDPLRIAAGRQQVILRHLIELTFNGGVKRNADDWSKEYGVLEGKLKEFREKFERDHGAPAFVAAYGSFAGAVTGGGAFDALFQGERDAIKTYYNNNIKDLAAAKHVAMDNCGEQGKIIGKVLGKISRAPLFPDATWVDRVKARLTSEDETVEEAHIAGAVRAWNDLRRVSLDFPAFVAQTFLAGEFVGKAKALCAWVSSLIQGGSLSPSIQIEADTVVAAERGVQQADGTWVQDPSETFRPDWQKYGDVFGRAEALLTSFRKVIRSTGERVRTWYRVRGDCRAFIASGAGASFKRNEVKRKKVAEIRGALRDFLANAGGPRPEKYIAYRDGPSILCRWDIPRRWLRVIRTPSEQEDLPRVVLDGFKIFVPSYPAKHAVAHLLIQVPATVSQACPPLFLTALKGMSFTEELGHTLVLCYDINQFRSRWTFTPALVKKEGDRVVSAGLGGDGGAKPLYFPEQHEAILQGIYCHSKSSVLADPLRGTTRTVTQGISDAGLHKDSKGREVGFLVKQRRSLLKSEKAAPFPLRQPSAEDPAKGMAIQRNPSFLDEMSAVEYFRAVKCAHLGQHSDFYRRRRRKLAGNKPIGAKPAPRGRPPGGRKRVQLSDNDARRLRLRAQADFTDARADQLRLASLEAQKRKILYCVLRFNVAGVAYERVNFAKVGFGGRFGRVLAKMPKNFADFRSAVEKWIVAGKFNLKNKIKWEPVSAPRTSWWCFEHLTTRGKVDRALWIDFGTCSDGGEMLESHYASAKNVGRKHSIFEDTDEDEDDVEDEDALIDLEEGGTAEKKKSKKKASSKKVKVVKVLRVKRPQTEEEWLRFVPRSKAEEREWLQHYLKFYYKYINPMRRRGY